MKLLRPIRSAAKLATILARHLLSAARAASRGDVGAAQEHLKAAAIFLHDDLIRLIVVLQRGLPGAGRIPAAVDRILIVKLDRIGDMVNAAPVLDALRRRFPGARLEIVGHPVPLSLLAGDDRIDGMIPYRSSLYHPSPLRPPGPRSWWLLLRLLARRYPLVVYLRGTFLFLPLGLTSRLGAARFVEGEHVVDRYLKAIEGWSGPISERELRLRIGPEADRAARGALSRGAPGDGPLIAIHATASAATKSWPAERFVELADRLRSEFGARVHFVGGPADEALLEAILAGARGPHAAHWSLGLPGVAALIARCDLFIGNDSGLSHVAAAVGTRQVVIWGPAPLSITYPRARPGRSLILWHDLPCRAGCPEFRCDNPIRLECLTKTRVDDVLAAAHPLLEGATAEPEGGDSAPGVAATSGSPGDPPAAGVREVTIPVFHGAGAVAASRGQGPGPLRSGPRSEG